MSYPNHELITPAIAAGNGVCAECASASVDYWDSDIIGFDKNGRKEHTPRDMVQVQIENESYIAQIRCAYYRSSVPFPRKKIFCSHWQEIALEKTEK